VDNSFQDTIQATWYIPSYQPLFNEWVQNVSRLGLFSNSSRWYRV